MVVISTLKTAFNPLFETKLPNLRLPYFPDYKSQLGSQTMCGK